MPRALSRLALDRGGPRDLGALRAGFEAAPAIVGAARREPQLPAELAAARGGDRAPCRRRWPAISTRRSPTNCRCSSATAASCAPATTASSTRCGRCATQSRRVIAGTGARAGRGDRHPLAEDPAQQRARLLHRSDRQPARRVMTGCGCAPRRASSIARPWPTPCASRRPSSPNSRAKIANAADRALAIELAAFDALRGEMRSARPTRIRAGAGALAVLDVSAALAAAGGERGLCRPVVDDSLALRDRRRPPSGGRAGAAARRPRARSSPTIATCRRTATRSTARSGCSPAPTWAASRPSCARTR